MSIELRGQCRMIFNANDIAISIQVDKLDNEFWSKLSAHWLNVTNNNPCVRTRRSIGYLSIYIYRITYWLWLHSQPPSDDSNDRFFIFRIAHRGQQLNITYTNAKRDLRFIREGNEYAHGQ